jgi:hypothetical protein
MKAFTLRAIKETPPYLNVGRCLTFKDAVVLRALSPFGANGNEAKGYTGNNNS